MHFINIAFYVVIVFGAYVIAFNNYIPSDVTMGLWLLKPQVITITLVLILFFLLKRVLTIFFFTAHKERARRIWLTILLLPSYVFIALFIVIDLNGLLDDKARTVNWNTNLVYFKDVKAACIAAGLDDSQFQLSNPKPDIIMVPRQLCNKIQGTQIVGSGSKHPYIIRLSGGRFGIPYVIDIIKAPDAV